MKRNQLLKTLAGFALICMMIVASVSAAPNGEEQCNEFGCCTNNLCEITDAFAGSDYELSFTLYCDGTAVFADGAIMNVEDLEEIYGTHCPVYLWRTVFYSNMHDIELNCEYTVLHDLLNHYYEEGIVVFFDGAVVTEEELVEMYGVNWGKHVGGWGRSCVPELSLSERLDMEYYYSAQPMFNCPGRPGGGSCQTMSDFPMRLRSINLGSNSTHCNVWRDYYGHRCRWCHHEMVTHTNVVSLMTHAFTTSTRYVMVHSPASAHPTMCRVRRTITHRCARCSWVASINSTYSSISCSNPNFIIPNGIEDDIW